MKKLYIVTDSLYLGDIDEKLDVQDIIASNGNMLQISKVENHFKVTNAVNGYGQNIRADYEDASLFTTSEQNTDPNQLDLFNQ